VDELRWLVALAALGVRKEVTIRLGEPVTSGWWTEVPITWQASYIGGPFPLMTGKLEVAPNEGPFTTLTVYGSYELAPEGVGPYLGEGLLRQVAQANVEEVAESIAWRLDSAAAAY